MILLPGCRPVCRILFRTCAGPPRKANLPRSAVADAETDRCLGMVNYLDGHIRNKRVAIGYIINPARHRQGIATEAVSAMLDHCFGELGLPAFGRSPNPTTARRARWLRNSGSAAKACCATTCGWGTRGATKCSMRSSGPTASARPDFKLRRLCAERGRSAKAGMS
jgi:hypothetical protein